MGIILVAIFAIIFILKKILKTKDKRKNKIIHLVISILLIIAYFVFGIVMIYKASVTNKPSDYGIIYMEDKNETYFYGYKAIAFQTIIDTLNSIKGNKGGKENYFNKYNYINVELTIQTEEFNYNETCPPDTAIQTLLDIANSKLYREEEYYFKIGTNGYFIDSITISDERIR